MTPAPLEADAMLAALNRELERLQNETTAARAVLDGVHLELAGARHQLGNMQGAQLVEVNEELVVAALQAQTDSDSAKAALIEAERSAELDPLTDLPNRVVMFDRVKQAIAFAKRHRTRMAVLFVDLDHFKQINDTLGHAVGDQALQRAAQCFVASVRAQDTVSRYGGDEFVIVLPEVALESDAVLVAAKVVEGLAGAHRIGTVEFSLSASIGISIYPDAGDDAETLILHADKAMYRAKQQGLRSRVFAPVDGSHVQQLAKEVSVDEEQQARLLRETNGSLVIAALDAYTRHDAAECERRLHAELLVWVASALRKQATDTGAAALLSDRRMLRAAFLQRKKQMRRNSQVGADVSHGDTAA